MTRPFKPANVPQLIPYISVRNPTEYLSFLDKAFGFKLNDKPMEQDGQVVHAEMKLGDALVMFGWENATGSTRKSPRTSGAPCSMGLYIYVENVDNFYKNAIACGAQSVQAPQDAFWGDRFCSLKDIDGYEWSFGTNVGECQTPPTHKHGAGCC